MNTNFLRHSLFLFAIILSIFNGKVFANRYCEISSTYDDIFEKIIDDKFYVKPGIIFVSADDIFLIVKGELVDINSIECDNNGVFIRQNAFKWGTCPICHWPLTFWGTCSNPSCPTNG